MIVSENKIYKELTDFISDAIDEDLVMFYEKFVSELTEEDRVNFDDDGREFIRDELQEIIDESFERELVMAIKFYQILYCYSFHGITNHNPPRFKFEKLEGKACEMFLISEGIINEPI